MVTRRYSAHSFKSGRDATEPGSPEATAPMPSKAKAKAKKN
jgi:hypothetical protein